MSEPNRYGFLKRPGSTDRAIERARSERAVEPGEPPAPDPPIADPAPAPLPTSAGPAPSPAPPEGPPPAKEGRPKGRRGDKDFEQVSAYLRRDLYARVRVALIEDGRPRDFSGLLAELLSAWLAGRQPR